MGLRIAYNISENTKGLLENFLSDLYLFRSWVLSEIEKYGALSMGQEIARDALEFLKSGNFEKKSISETILDELITIYICSYCDHGPGKNNYLYSGSFINKWKYEPSTELVNEKCDTDTKQKWNYLKYGRSVSSDNQFSKAISKDILIGYWTVMEQKQLLQSLKLVFGSKTEMMDYYYKHKINKSSLVAKCSGLECVYDILEEGISANKEIVFQIEF